MTTDDTPGRFDESEDIPLFNTDGLPAAWGNLLDAPADTGRPAGTGRPRAADDCADMSDRPYAAPTHDPDEHDNEHQDADGDDGPDGGIIITLDPVQLLEHLKAAGFDVGDGDEAAAAAQRTTVNGQWLAAVLRQWSEQRAKLTATAHMLAAIAAERDAALEALAATMADHMRIHPDIPHDIPDGYAQHPGVIDLADSLNRARVQAETATQATDAVYTERNTWAALAVALLGGVVCEDADPEYPGWPLVYADTPAGQVSAHIAPEDAHLTAALPRTVRCPWDGADQYENTTRLRAAIEHYGRSADHHPPE